MTQAVRKHDSRHLITAGIFLIDGQAENLPLGLTPAQLAEEVDFLSVHLYPKEGEMPAATAALRALSVGKLILIEETGALNCSIPFLKRFIADSKPYAAGWLGFFWGKTAAEYRKSGKIEDALMADWLDLFQAAKP